MLRDYDDTIAYLERLVATPLHNHPDAGLQRTRLLLRQVANPHERFATVHVTGTSGKGSTAAMAAAILRAAGYRVGLFTSPHLVRYTERIVVDGESIPDDEWTRLLNRLHPMIEAMSHNALPGYHLGRPAFMQVLWPLGALYFSAQGVDVAVVEVGMGGRYDATNVNNARVGVVTNVSLEHTATLGASIAAIARHKAGIAKPGGILVSAAAEPDAQRVIAAECRRVGTRLWCVEPAGAAAEATRMAVTYAGSEDGVAIATPLRAHERVQLAMLGHHQWANAACAAAAADALHELGILRVEREAVREGLTAARVPGRLEWVADDPPTLLDGAHNPAAARALAVALRALFAERPLVLVLGILGDKDAAAMVDALAPLAQEVVVTEPPWERRAGNAGEVARLVRQHVGEVVLEPDVGAALAVAQGRARTLRAPLVVTGSLILVGAVRDLVQRHER